MCAECASMCRVCVRACLLLPPANEVWGKVMFLHLSVSHSVHREGGWIPNMHHRSHHQGRSAPGGGVCIPSGEQTPSRSAYRGLGGWADPQDTWDTTGWSKAGGTHPTGIYSCFRYVGELKKNLSHKLCSTSFLKTS